MFAAFAAMSFAWQAFTIVVLLACALNIALAIPILIGAVQTVFEDESDDTCRRANVTPIDPHLDAQLRGEWDTFRPSARVLPTAETRTLEVEIHW